jgi:glyoxylase-like metal-dependent hydrolase (beta-lactamase superfamily II)
MRLKSIHTGFFKLDGGAMFGVVPRRMWAKLNPPDENNLCTWSMRCLLIQTGEGRNILVDTGIGHKQDAKFRSHFEPHGQQNLLDSLAQAGLSAADITDVFLTHLHFDHCGGAISLSTEGVPKPTFPNAIYWSNQKHWDWAMQPNPREQASFLKENFTPLRDWGLVRFVEEIEGIELLPNIFVHFAYGHTEAMMYLKIKNGDKTFIYGADLMPSQWHVPMPYVMAYDIRPLVTLKEKEQLLQEAVAEGAYFILEHDPIAACMSLKKDEKGRVVVDETFEL